MSTLARHRVTRRGTILVLGPESAPVSARVEWAAVLAGLDVLKARHADALWNLVQVAEIVVFPLEEAAGLHNEVLLLGAAHMLGKKVLVVTSSAQAVPGRLAAMRVVRLEEEGADARLVDMLTDLRKAPLVERTVVPLPSEEGSGEEVDAEVVIVQANLAVVRTGDGREGVLVPDDLSWSRKVRDLRRVLSPGQVIHGVLVEGPDDGRRFSVRLLEEDPWPALEALADGLQHVDGVVFSVEPRIGLFVTLDGTEINGLVPRSKLPDHLKLEPGDRVTVLVEHVDQDAREVGLRLVSAKATSPGQISHHPGDHLTGRVVKVDAARGYALVDLPDGFTAILPFRRLSPSGQAAVTSGTLRPGVRIPVVVADVDPSRQRVELTDDVGAQWANVEDARATAEFLAAWGQLEPFVLIAERTPRDRWPRPFPIRFDAEQQVAIQAWGIRHATALDTLRNLRDRIASGAAPGDVDTLSEAAASANGLLEELPQIKVGVDDREVRDQRRQKEKHNALVGRRVGTLRRAKRLSQEQLAAQVDVHRTYIGHLEAGLQTPSTATIVRIAEALDVDVGELLRPMQEAPERS